MNTAYIAHIVAADPNGPRGDKKLSPQLAKELSNLLLLCDEHHRLVDREGLQAHPPERLRSIKKDHETRIETLTALQPPRKSHVLLYGANIGEHPSSLSWQQAAEAMLPKRYPAEKPGFELGIQNSAFHDRESRFWEIEWANLRRQFKNRLLPRLQRGDIEHLSIFALAPQPLLIALGHLLSDIPAADVYQRHREPPTWNWDDAPVKDFSYQIEEPRVTTETVALNLSLSATIDNTRIISVLGNNTSIWRMTIKKPNNDFLKNKAQLQLFREGFRILLDRIKKRHGEDTTIRLFPAVPVAIAVEIGRVRMPKADLRFQIYDQNRETGGFKEALNIPPEQERP